jgi:hypothetical protein
MSGKRAFLELLKQEGVEATDLLKQALADGGPALIEVTLDRAFKPM